MKSLPTAALFSTAGLSFLLIGCKPSDPPLSPDPSPQSVQTDWAQPDTAADLAQPDAESGDPDDVLVTVNGETITRGEADAHLARMLQQSGQQIPPQYRQQVAQQFMPQVLESLVGRKLMQAAVKEGDFEADEAEIEDIVQELTASLPEGLTLETALLQQGLTEDALREDIAENIRMRKLTETWTAEVSDPTEADVETFYRDHPEHFSQPESATARHILFRVEDDADEQTRAEQLAQADAVREQLLGGADFAELAAEHSDCPSAERGGLLGEFGRGDMVPEFDAVVFTLEPGTVSDIVKTDFGYHVIRVESRKPASVTALEEASEDIRKHLKQESERAVIETRIDGLQEAADIQYLAE